MARIEGTESGEELSGESGDDLIYGLGGNDTLWGADGFDRVFGGEGDDQISDSAGGDVLKGGRGFDTLSISHIDWWGGGIPAFEFTFVVGGEMTTPGGSTARGFERLDIIGGNGADTITGGRNDDVVRGWQSDDWLDGGRGGDHVIGDNGDDTLNGGRGDDLLSGGGHDDVLYGGDGNDTLMGGTSSDLYQGSDTLSGGKGADELRIGPNGVTILYDTSDAGVFADLTLGFGYGGDAQGDTYVPHGFGGALVVGSAYDDFLASFHAIDGGGGDDRLQAGWGTRQLTGGDGLDRFVIQFDTQIIWERVTITDFDQAGGERIDLSSIDARPQPGYQAFIFIGHDAFTAAGQVRWEVVEGRTVIEMNVNADVNPDHTVYLDGVYELSGADFIL
jgi:serralysin